MQHTTHQCVEFAEAKLAYVSAKRPKHHEQSWHVRSVRVLCAVLTRSSTLVFGAVGPRLRIASLASAQAVHRNPNLNLIFGRHIKVCFRAYTPRVLPVCSVWGPFLPSSPPVPPPPPTPPYLCLLMVPSTPGTPVPSGNTKPL